MNPRVSVPLEAVAKIIQGGRLKLSGKNFVKDGFPAYGAGGINGFLEVAEFDKPAIVLSSIGARCGKCFYADRQWTSLANTQLIFPDAEKVDAKFLWYQLNDEASWIRSGTGQPFIKPSNIKTRRVSLPPLAEQRRIAAILDKADALRAKRREAIAKLDQLLQSVFLDMFGDPVTNPRGWPKASIGSFASFITSGSRGWAKYYADSGAKFIRIQNLVNGELDMEECAFVRAPESAEARRTLVQEGDVLVSITADLGRTAVVPEGLGAAHINQHIAIIRLFGIDPSYVSYFLASPGGQIQFEKSNRSAVKAGLNFDDLRSLQIFVPPAEVQGQYLQRIESIKSLRRSSDLEFVGLDKLFFGLQQRAFAGTL